MKKDNTLFYLLFLIAVFVIISVAKSSGKKEDKKKVEVDSDAEPTPAPDTEIEVDGVKVPEKNVYQSNGNKYINNSAPQPSQPNSDQYDYNQEGLAGTLNKGKYTK